MYVSCLSITLCSMSVIKNLVSYVALTLLIKVLFNRYIDYIQLIYLFKLLLESCVWCSYQYLCFIACEGRKIKNKKLSLDDMGFSPFLERKRNGEFDYQSFGCIMAYISRRSDIIRHL